MTIKLKVKNKLDSLMENIWSLQYIKNDNFRTMNESESGNSLTTNRVPL